MRLPDSLADRERSLKWQANVDLREQMFSLQCKRCGTEGKFLFSDVIGI